MGTLSFVLLTPVVQLLFHFLLYLVAVILQRVLAGVYTAELMEEVWARGKILQEMLVLGTA